MTLAELIAARDPLTGIVIVGGTVILILVLWKVLAWVTAEADGS